MKLNKYHDDYTGWYELKVDLKFNVSDHSIENIKKYFMKECESAFYRMIGNAIESQYKESKGKQIN